MRKTLSSLQNKTSQFHTLKYLIVLQNLKRRNLGVTIYKQQHFKGMQRKLTYWPALSFWIPYCCQGTILVTGPLDISVQFLNLVIVVDQKTIGGLLLQCALVNYSTQFLTSGSINFWFSIVCNHLSKMDLPNNLDPLTTCLFYKQ